ncbi:MAG: HD domain-containing protein [Gammaproteobacteria bacterium]|nr:HD domain-containing protein [Gammaproteobacteria bacterium]
MALFSRKTIKSLVATALVIQFSALALIVGIALNWLDLRKHDYLILNLSGQLRVISEVMLKQSENYLSHAARDYETYYRDLNLFRKDLDRLVEEYDAIINDFVRRELTQEVTGLSESITCSWDGQSRSQLDQTAAAWYRFRDGLQGELGPDPEAPRLEAAANYIVQNGQQLVWSSTALTEAFRRMMEGKLSAIKTLNQVGLGISILIALIVLWLLYSKVFRPLDRTVKGFHRVEQGQLDHKVPGSGFRELDDLSTAFNSLTQRLSSLFRLTQRINTATNLDDTLRFVLEEFRDFQPIDWVGMLRPIPGGRRIQLMRAYTDGSHHPDEGAEYELEGSIVQRASEQHTPYAVNELRQQDYNDEFLSALKQNGFGSALLLPLSTASREGVILVFATEQEDSYNNEHIELLTNIGAQVGSGFDKTIGLETMVISSLTGLAKLAESRDPETGDHLLRMSHYSAIVADELGKRAAYRDIVTPTYVRDIFHFAPMHDIGKVGIEDNILLKPGRLDPEERREMERHPLIGAEVLRRCEAQMNHIGYSVFQVGIEIAEAHHEKFDGSGYPHGLSGESIPLSARIVACADVFDALTSRRPYKEAWPVEKALDLLRDEAGHHFDPEVVEALHDALPRIMDIYNTHKHI